jgi:hypothetical protein
MENTTRNRKLMAQAFPVLISILVPLSAFLAFLIQPLLGKRLVPVFSGSDGSWIGCVVYFQLTFLLGYGWAAWLGRKRPLFQLSATLILCFLAILSFRLPSSEPATAGLTVVLWRLAITTLPSLVLLFSTRPLLQGWLRWRGLEVPYHLHVIANLASLGALLFYPFFFEPALFLPELAFYWQCGLLVVAGLLATAGYIFQQTTVDQPRPTVDSPAETFPPGLLPLALWLGALSCLGLLGATRHLAAEIGSTPLAWVAPLGLYLFSFMLTFSGRWRRWMTLSTIVWLAVSLTGFMVVKGFTAVTVNYLTAWWLLSLTASGSFLTNALLQSLWPAPRGEKFYLVLAAGGLIGAWVAGSVVPHLLARPTELVLASVALLITGLLWLNDRRNPATVAVTACVLLIPVLGLGLHQAATEALGNGRILHLRDLTGHLMVKTDARSVVLSSETTTRASQLTMDAAARHRPTLYYTESTGIGRVLEKLMADRPKLSVGIVGLGAGTLATYARSTDTYDFWDSDPKMHRVARENFTFAAESAGTANLSLRDGRAALADSKQDYDVIVIDNVTAAGTPAYLLTKEAMMIYERRLVARDGLLVINASSRYARLFPIVEATARTLSLSAVGVTTDISDSTATSDWDPTRTEYIIVCRPGLLQAVSAWFPAEEDKGRVKRQITALEPPLFNAQLIWHDDRNAALDNFAVGRFLFEP